MPDDAGVHSGVTTAVDQGGTGAYTIAAFNHYIAERAIAPQIAYDFAGASTAVSNESPSAAESCRNC